MSNLALEIRGLEKRFPAFHLGPLDLSVPTGAIYGFIGPNGAGKTTTIDLIFGMGRKDAGSIRALGLDHEADCVAMKRQVGYVSPELNYAAWGSIGRAIAFVRSYYATWDDAYCQKLLQDLNLGWNDRIATLSFGTRIKLSLVMALSWRPRVLILDEPTVGLDAVSRHQIFGELLAAVQDGERSVLISSHALSDLERLTDHVGMIKGGKMVLEGLTSEIVEAYRLVDFTSDESHPWEPAPGWHVQKREHNRWRVLVDTRQHDLDRLSERGGRQINAAPVSLEDLFVALAKE